MKKFIALLLFAAVFGVAGYFVWQNMFATNAGTDKTMTLYGNVEIRRVNLGFNVFGQIVEMPFKEGDKILRNSVVARLDRQPYQDDVEIAAAQVKRAEANLKKLQTGNRPQEIAQAHATLNERIATLDVLNAEVRRAHLLIDKQNISPQEFDNVIASQKEATARKQLAEETLNLLIEGFRQEDIDAGEAQFAEAKANLKRTQTLLGYTELHCPNDGILLTRVEEPGAVVNQGQTVLVLSLQDEVWVYVYLPEPDLGKIAPGMKAKIYTDSAPDKPYGGQVGYISPEAEFTPKNVETPRLRTDLVYRVRIIADNPDDGLRQGMPVTVVLAKD
ncbi:MAG: efflux RND transporter periplasmic adaptor subunit [Planctomycetaceae bacterium]|jgi:HlyD family secretion protein|nr:efflux RND transporter periplasmic adaptor subunit [Planctomycetaceae bacterium]